MIIHQALAPVSFAFIKTVFAKHEGGDEDLDSDPDDDDDGATSSTAASTTASSVTVSHITPSPTPSSPPILQFLAPSNTTVCGNITFVWTYAGSTDLALTITITNERSAGIPRDNQSVLISRTLTNTISSKAGIMTWDHVDVPVGAYVALAFDTSRTAGINAQSPPFFVSNSLDMRCLISVSATSLPTSTFPSTSITSQTSDAASQTPATPDPQGLSGGALAGTVVGVIAGVLLLLMAFMFPNFWRRSLPRRQSLRASRPGGPYLLF